MIKDILFSLDGPKDINQKIFHILNMSVFIIFSLVLLSLKSNYPLERIESSIYFHWWIVIFVIFIGYLIIKRKIKHVLMFISLTIYAHNRTVLFLMVLNIVYFPIELIIFSFMDNYQAKGLEISTLIIKTISYVYFYFLFVRLIYFFISPKVKTLRVQSNN